MPAQNAYEFNFLYDFQMIANKFDDCVRMVPGTGAKASEKNIK